ncbi:ATP-dependent metallopeptidase FtsH/Yme1/Tma family protein [Cellulosilyticum ruminicola]|uniref:ATP-dependent metallopeptidase FtsH/Yme1/Tma family protein n=1 Tax=Cellulosilyticum ruminicola TaxID=425254 RepID=UPI0006D171FD|nr:ATP-dependent metallopeptidase FtsH/Yme1/Tma family protein [Cellulosilyticum ruminicola]
MKQKKNIKKYILVGLLCGLVACGSVLVARHKAVNKVSYTQFLRDIQNEQVEKVELSNASTLKFKLKNSDTVYTTDNPRKETLKEALLLNNINVVEKAQSDTSMIQYIISISLMIAMFIAIFNMVKKQNNSRGKMSIGDKKVAPHALKHGFDDIAGNEEAKEQVAELIDFMKEPEKYAKMGARMPKGFILYGPPGTGKTLLAKAIAKEAGVSFFSVSGSDFMQMYVGVGASRVRELFKTARKEGKAVIFIDEIDAIGKKRSSGSMQGNDEKDQTLNALLTEMSGFKDDEGIVVIAATNRLDTLDDALLRPGRFDRHIEVGYPDFKAREQIIKLHLKNKPLSDDVEVANIAKQTVYFTGAMLENLLNEAAIYAVSTGKPCIDQKAIDTAFYTVVAGKEKKDRSGISEMDQRITAYHEAGHALVTKLIAPENSVTKVTIIPSTKGFGGFSMNIPKDKMYMNKTELLNSIKISLAGRAAEEIIFGKNLITTGASNDIEKASESMRNILLRYGMDTSYGLVNLNVLTGKQTVEDEAFITRSVKYMGDLYEETKALIIAHQDKLEALAESLIEKETLNEQEIASFF